MPTSLYLDTARLGQMSPSAQLAHIDFVRLAAEEAGSLYFDDFLRHGTASSSVELQRRYSRLASWKGVTDLKRDLKRLTGARDGSRLLLANRSTQLMRLSARLFFGQCSNVLVTDLSWPSYATILRREAAQSGNRLTNVSLRTAIYRKRLTATELVDRLAAAFVTHRCDGLFLPAVDNHGIRMPVEDIVQEIRRRAELRFVVVDGAQALCHIPIHLSADFCDLFLTGCHKWLRACHPMGMAFCGHPGSQDDIETTLSRLLATGEIDDPLLSFSEELERGAMSQFGETVSLAALFSCRGAVDDVMAAEDDLEASLSARMANGTELIDFASGFGWKALAPHAGLRSGIVLLQCGEARIRALEPDVLRRRLLERGIAATAYTQGRVRLSMPARPWRWDQLAVLASALGSFPQNTRRPHRGIQWTSNSPVTNP